MQERLNTLQYSNLSNYKIIILTIVFTQNLGLYGQEIDNQFLNICKDKQSLSRRLIKNSTLTENQGKIDIKYYGINIDINIEQQEIYGFVQINGTVGIDQPDSIEIDLTNNLTVDSIFYDNEYSDFLHENNLIKIPANIANSDGYSFNIQIFYHGHPVSTGFGSFNFDEHQGIDHIWTLSEPYGARDWWPCKDDPSDKADSLDILITVPSEQIAVSNGILTQELFLDDGRITYHWTERYPISTYLVSITSYPYIKWEDEYIGMEGDTLPLEYYVYPDHYDLNYDNYLLTKQMMNAFAGKFGEYPFMNEKYGHVEFGRGGGMEHQTISSLGGYSEWLIAHELGHQWWGNLITCSSFHHIWLNEGFARFCEALWYEASQGREAYKQYWQNHAYYGSGTIYVENPNTVGQIFNGNLSYNKAGWVLHMLRGVMGDSLFFETLQSYASNDSLAYASATTENFQLVCENVSGIDFHDFFQQWIYNEYYPKYTLSWEISDLGDLIVAIEQTQNWQIFHMPIELQIIFPEDTSTFFVDNQLQFEEYNLGFFDAYPNAIWLDPNNWILKEVEYMSISDQLPSESNILLYPAYPNPFNPKTSIQFFIPDYLGEIESSLRIFDLRGNLVETLNTDRLFSGHNKIIWNANKHTSGIYFIQLNTNDAFYSQKIQLIK